MFLCLVLSSIGNIVSYLIKQNTRIKGYMRWLLLILLVIRIFEYFTLFEKTKNCQCLCDQKPNGNEVEIKCSILKLYTTGCIGKWTFSLPTWNRFPVITLQNYEILVISDGYLQRHKIHEKKKTNIVSTFLF